MRPTRAASSATSHPGGSGGDGPERCAQQDLHRLACEAGRAGTWYVRLETQECTLSPTAAALLGLPAQELTIPAEIWRARIDADHLATLEEQVLASIHGDRAFEFELRATRGDGKPTWLLLRGEIVRDGRGAPTRIHGAIVDLTEHKRAKDALKTLNETLEQRVAKRTEELLKVQEALRQSQKLEALGQLTGGIAHDFNNLLTPIMAGLDLLQEHAIAARDRRLIDGALKSAMSARMLVQRLLAFARRQALQPTRVEVDSLVEGMADLLARTLGPRIRVALDLAPDLKPVCADRNQLEMAILNLGVNARDAMPDGGSLVIRAANERVATPDGSGLVPGSYVRLSIVDDGIGMDEATCRRAVEPFFSTKPAGEGTGLGLSTVDGLASQMGGAFRLRSQVGAGTTATLWLPLWTGPATTDGSAAVAPALVVQSGVALVVDDHELVRASTAEMLASLGYEVIELASGEAAFEHLRSGKRADLIVTDQLMPGMSGIELARLARELIPKLPVLLVSGLSRLEEVPPDLPCLAKPFGKSALAEKVAHLRPAQEAAASTP